MSNVYELQAYLRAFGYSLTTVSAIFEHSLRTLNDKGTIFVWLIMFNLASIKQTTGLYGFWRTLPGDKNRSPWTVVTVVFWGAEDFVFVYTKNKELSAQGYILAEYEGFSVKYKS